MLDLEELELEERLLEELVKRVLPLLLEELLLGLIDFLPRGSTTSTIMLLRREDELLEEELLELRELELLELEEDDVLFSRPGIKIFLSLISTFLSSRISSSSLMLTTFMIFSAALSPT